MNADEKKERLRIALIVQVALAKVAPRFLAYAQEQLNSEQQQDIHQLLELFASVDNGHPDQPTFAAEFRVTLDQVWGQVISEENIWFAGEAICHSPNTTEACLYYLTRTGFLGLEPKLLPALLEKIIGIGDLSSA